jgi:hypothetical protein
LARNLKGKTSGKTEVTVDFASTDMYKMETMFEDIKGLVQSRTIRKNKGLALFLFVKISL